MRLADILALDRRELEDTLRRVLREEFVTLLPEAISRAQRPFVSARELSERLGVSLRTVRSWQRSGKIPYVKVGRRVLFDVAAVEQALREGEVSAKWTT